MGLAAHTVDDIAQLAIVHVDNALPGDTAHVKTKVVTLLNMVIDHSGKQVVCCSNCMKVSGKMKV